jgi:ATP-dependent 26S proteasome regulatory subunit
VLVGSLEVIDTVGPRERRVLIMTNHHIAHLDEVLIRPGRMDKKVKLKLANKKMMVDLFSVVFKPMDDNEAPPKDAQSDGRR